MARASWPTRPSAGGACLRFYSLDVARSECVKLSTQLKLEGSFVKVTSDQNGMHVNVVGSIGEATPLFTLPIGQATQLTLDLSQVTSINSIGVKHWIQWTVRIPKNCPVKLINTPFVIVNQASMVFGFSTPNMKIESFMVPYACDSCRNEQYYLQVRGKDYDYAQPGKPAWNRIAPEYTCLKCGKGKLEPDFSPEKSLKFLG